MTYSAGSAAIKVEPSFAGFIKDAKKKLALIDLGTISVKVDADVRPAARKIAALRRDAARNVSGMRVDIHTEAAQTKVAKLRRDAARNVSGMRVDIDTDRAMAQIEALRAAARDPIPVPVRPDIDGTQVDRDIARVGQGLSYRLRRRLRFTGLLNLTVVGVIGTAKVLGDLAAITHAAAEAARAVALIPAISFGGLAGLGSLVTGISGIPAAFKAQAAASGDATDAAEKHRDAIFGVSEAEFRLEQAQLGVQDANRASRVSQQALTEAYRDARRSIRDMNNELADTKLSVEDAALSVQEAAQRLQEVRFDPTADATTRARAELSYRQAVQRLTEQQNKVADLEADTAAANAAGVEGSKLVVDAKQAVVDAARGEAEAQHELTAAYESLRKAQYELANPGGAQGTLDQALAKLSPNARQFVEDVRALGPAWTDARKAAQDALTEGMGPAVTRLAQVQLPNLKAGMVGINTAFNAGFRAVLAELSTEKNKADFKIALDNTAAGFRNAAKGAAPLTAALTKLITVGSTFLPGFGDAIARLAERFNSLIQRTAADGSLRQWMRDGLDATKDLAKIIGHLGSSIASVFRAASEGGPSLKSLEELTDRMATFLKSVEAQDRMKEFWSDTRQGMEAIRPALQQIPALLRGVYDGFRAWASVLLPFLGAAAALLTAHPGLVKAIVIAWLSMKTIGPILTGIQGALAGVTARLAAFDAGMAAGAARGAGVFRSALGGIGAALGPGGIFAVGIAAAAVGIGLLAQRHQEAAAAAEEQRRKLDALRETLDQQTGAVTAQTISTTTKDLESRGFLERAQTLGVDPRAYVQAGLGLDQRSRDTINQRLTAIITEQGSSGSRWKEVQQYTGLSSTDIAQALQGVPEAVEKYADAVTAAQDKISESEDPFELADLSELKEELNDVGESAATLGGEMNGLGTNTGRAAESQRRVQSALEGTFVLTEQGQREFDALGIAVTSVPDDKTVAVKALTEEQERKLRDLGAQIERLPDHTVKIVLNDEAARRQIREIVSPAVKPVEVVFTGTGEYFKPQGAQPIPRAAGGEISGGVPGRDSVPIMAMPGEHVLTTGDVQAMGGQDGVYRFRAALARGEVRGYADGGEVGTTGTPIVDSMIAVVTPRFPGIKMVSGLRFTDHGYHSVGKAADFSNGGDSTPEMRSLAAFIAANYPQSLELIHQPFNHNIKDGKDVGAGPPVYDAETMGEHRNHVHWAAASPVSAPGTTSFTLPPPGTSNSTTTTTTQQLYPQAPLPGRASDEQLAALSARAAVDAANSERNQIYANPASTDQDRLAADIKYQRAQNALEAATKNDTSALSLQGIFAKAGSILATGLLSAFGLEDSIFSESNVYNKSLNTLWERFGPQAGGGYAYQPQNLPSTVTTTTPQYGEDPYLSGTIPGSGPITGLGPPDPGTHGVATFSIPGTKTRTGASGPVVDRVAGVMSDVGWHVGAQWDALDQLVKHESDWNPNAKNPTSTAYGLFQFLDSTWATVGGHKTSDPGGQALYGRKYIQQRYGDPAHAWAFWQAQSPHWYADGGWVGGPGGSRGDGIAARVSPGEYVVNAYDAARNGPVLEAINSSSWSPVRVDGGTIAGSRTGSAAGHNFSTTIVEPRVADVGDLVALAERSAQVKAIGLMSAMR